MKYTQMVVFAHKLFNKQETNKQKNKQEVYWTVVEPQNEETENSKIWQESLDLVIIEENKKKKAKSMSPFEARLVSFPAPEGFSI